MLSSSYRSLFRNTESIFSLLKGHEEQRGSEQGFTWTSSILSHVLTWGLCSLNSQSSLQRAIQTLHFLGVCGNQHPYLSTILPTHLSFTFCFLEAQWLFWNLDSLWIKLYGAYTKMCAPGRTLRDFLGLSVVGKVKWTEIKNWLTSLWIIGVWFDSQGEVKPCRNSCANLSDFTYELLWVFCK